MFDRFKLMPYLATGEFQSGRELAEHFGVSQMTIHNAVCSLCEQGIQIDVVCSRGYRLKWPIELLEYHRIKQYINSEIVESVAELVIFPTLNSTNTYLMEQAKCDAQKGRVCLAEHQSLGKGRRGRRWVSPFAENIYVSLLWRFDNQNVSIGGLGLLVAVDIVRMLELIGIRDAAVKWPNDILCKGKKLSGILMETVRWPNGAVHVVTGVGINVHMNTQQVLDISQPWTDLSQELEARTPSKNKLAALLVTTLVGSMHTFEKEGLEGLMQVWKQYDYTYGEAVHLLVSGQLIKGQDIGIDSFGRLMLNVKGQCQTYSAGDLSLRRDI